MRKDKADFGTNSIFFKQARTGEGGDTDMTNEFLKKMQNHATAEATRLGKSNHGKLRLIGTAIGIVVVVLVALWIAYHP
jgi:hypothetical protein